MTSTLNLQPSALSPAVADLGLVRRMSMHFRFQCFAAALLASCSTVTQSPNAPRYLNGATPELAAEVLPIIRSQTKEPISEIERKPDGTVEVKTGGVRGGPWFVFKKAKGRGGGTHRCHTICCWSRIHTADTQR